MVHVLELASPFRANRLSRIIVRHNIKAKENQSLQGLSVCVARSLLIIQMPTVIELSIVVHALERNKSSAEAEP